ncbi:MAG: hypothetical protein ACOC2C_01785 [Cyclonatronaceae bacterium]
MKTLGNIPHPQMNITVFMWNNKYIIKFEAGPYEQVYKLDAGHFEHPDEVKALITDSFCEAVISRFMEMNAGFSALMKNRA